MVFESAPASNRIHSDCKLPGVRHIIPAFDDSSLTAISEPHRAPLSMSAEDSQGLTALIIFGSHARRASAAAPLLVPDQLMNTSTMLAIMPQTREDGNKSTSAGGPFLGTSTHKR